MGCGAMRRFPQALKLIVCKTATTMPRNVKNRSQIAINMAATADRERERERGAREGKKGLNNVA